MVIQTIRKLLHKINTFYNIQYIYIHTSARNSEKSIGKETITFVIKGNKYFVFTI